MTHSFPTRRSSDLPKWPPSQRRPRTGGTKDAMTGNPHPARWALAALWRLKLAAIQAVLVWSGLAMAALVFLQVIIRYFTTGSRSEEHTSELQSLMRISYAVFCLKKKKPINQ